MAEPEVLINEDCPCPKKACKMWGNCVMCVKSHLEHRQHVPVCMQQIMKPVAKQLNDLLEIETKDE